MHHRTSRTPVLLAVVSAGLLLAGACQNSEAGGPSTTSGTATTSTSGVTATGEFNDHTVSSIGSVAEFERLARSEGSQAAVKFAIPELSSPGVVWMDGGFYELHDEWYWFRLLNGESVPGLATSPVDLPAARGFESIADVYEWAEGQSGDLPLDLRFTTERDRLYSQRYYDLALVDKNKTYGLGTLVRYETDGGDRWVVELEFSEPTTPESVAQFLERLAETLPSDIGNHLEWVVRSPMQEETAQAMVASGDPYADQVVHYADLVPPGEVAIYNPGLVAGRLRLVEDESDLNRAGPDDILVMENVPDWLPPATAILTASPQTPLAHVNLLARNRGIPNASISGLLDDPAIGIAASSRAYAVVSAEVSGEFEITLITSDQYQAWRDLSEQPAIVVPAIDLEAAPTVLPLTELAATIETEVDIAALRPTIGGKSAGFLTLISAEGVTTPDSPIAVTVAPYFRHLALVETELDALLADDDFQDDARIRFLTLEGRDEYDDTYTTESDAEGADTFESRHQTGPIRTVLDADGFMNLLRDTEMADDDLTELTDALTSNFASLSELQGLRFRSSSSVEDIEGFTGAGLYDSNTGFLDPELQADEDDHKKTIERTIKKTWASYWSFEAFEERRLENVDHRSGGMGVLVHPRFDDELEVDNGVATLMLLLDDTGTSAVLTINVQAGDVSVANPDDGTDVLPEQITVQVSPAGELTIERTGASTLVADNERVMDDAAVEELAEQLQTAATLWRNRGNRDLRKAHQAGILTLDFEFKHMAAGWPAMANGEVRPARLVVKQARSLDPDLRGVPSEVQALLVPRDVLARAVLVEQVSCPSGAAEAGFVEVTTNGAVAGDVLPRVLRYADETGVRIDAADGFDDGCERTTVFASPEQRLIELLETGEGLQIG